MYPHFKHHRLRNALLCLFIATSLTTYVRAEEPKKGTVTVKPASDKDQDTKFLRFIEDEDGGGKLETAIATYENADGVKVHLVSAVHIGERKYYEDLAKTFNSYDALLYEMVKPKDAPVPGPGAQARSDSMVSMFQRFLKDALELEFQLDALDYTAKNFVHADLDAETFTRLQEERGENLFTLMLKQMLAEMEKPQQNIPDISLPELAAMLLSPDSSRHMKMLLARSFEDLEAKVAGIEGKEGTVLVAERNKACVNVIKEQMEKGKKNMGVFYGAAHMPDIDKRITEMGFKRTRTEWRTAWDMTPREGDVIIKRVKKKQPAEAGN